MANNFKTINITQRFNFRFMLTETGLFNLKDNLITREYLRNNGVKYEVDLNDYCTLLEVKYCDVDFLVQFINSKPNQ